MLVPVKSFRAAKGRLAPVLGADTRADLARWCADRVVAAAGELPVFVACDDEDVAEWARSRGATVLWHPGIGLNASVTRSVAELSERGILHVVVAHGDLPRASRLASVVTPDSITLVPDAHDDGTNVAAVPTAAGFAFSYGPGSFRRHVALALDTGLAVSVRRDPLLALDIDTPSDLAHPLVQEVLPEWLPTSPANPLPSRR